MACEMSINEVIKSLRAVCDPFNDIRVVGVTSIVFFLFSLFLGIVRARDFFVGVIIIFVVCIMISSIYIITVIIVVFYCY